MSSFQDASQRNILLGFPTAKNSPVAKRKRFSKNKTVSMMDIGVNKIFGLPNRKKISDRKITSSFAPNKFELVSPSPPIDKTIGRLILSA